MKILYVEDNADDREITRIQLQRYGPDIEIVTARSAREAQEILHAEDFHCVLSDFQMPGMDGLEFLSAIRESGNTTPFIFLTGQGNEKLAAKALRAGADDYFTKEIGLAHYQRLVNSIRRVAEASQSRQQLDEVQRKARENEEMYHSLVNQANDAIVIIQNYYIVFANAQASKLIGVDDLVADARNFLEFIHPRDKERVTRNYVARLAGDRSVPQIYQACLVHELGHDVPIEVNVSMITYKNNPASLVIMRDLSERLEVERERQESEEKYRQLLMQANDAIAILQDDKVALANSRLSQMLGYQPGEETSRPFLSFVHEAEHKRVAEYYARRLKGLNVPNIYQTLLQHRDGHTIEAEINAGRVTFQGNPAVLLVIRDVSDRRRIERQHETSERRLAELIDNAPFGAHMYDITPDGDLIFSGYNSSAQTLLGVDHKELLGKKLLDAFPGLRGTDIPDTFFKVSRDGKPRQYEQLFYQDKEIDGAYQVHVFKTGEAHISVLFRDIAERLKNAEKQRRTEDLLYVLAETTEEIFWISLPDRAMDLEYVSPAFERVWGIPVKEVLRDGSLWSNCIDERDNKRISPRFEAFVRKGADYDVEYRIMRPDGSLRWIHNRGYAIRDAEGNVVRLAGIARDITSRRQVEMEVERQRIFLSNIIDIIPHIVFVKDADSRFILSNKAQADAYGTTVEKLIGKTEFETAPSEQEARHFNEDDRKVLEEGKDVVIPDDRVTYADGSVHYLHTIKRPIRSDSGDENYVLGVSIDITEQRIIEQKLRESRDSLEVAYRQSENFAYAVSHDLQRPLRHVAGFTELLENHLKDAIDDRGREILGKIRRATTDMSQQIADLLKLARVGSAQLNPETIDIQAVINNLVDDLRREHPERRIEAVVAELPQVKADRGLLQLVLQNLLDNAVKYSGSEEQTSITVSGELRDGQVSIHVQDNGIGFEQEQATKLFKPFQRLHGDSRIEGHGIGLATVAAIIHRHGGEVSATASPGEGARFTFTLPSPAEPWD